MQKRYSGLVIVPHGKARTRYLRIRAVGVVALLIVTAGGFVGYFLPFSSLSVNVTEQTHKKNLSEQNRKLFKEIHQMSGTLKSLEQQIRALEKQRDGIEDMTGINTTLHTTPAGRTSLIDSLDLGRVHDLVQRTHTLFQMLALKMRDDPAAVATIPVIRPVEEDEAAVTARFCDMRDPFTGATKFHYGTDFGGERGTPVRATADGVVSKTETHETWGRRIVITHGFGFSTVYAHLSSANVRKGQRVKRGDAIGTIGASGLATGPHLHYEIHLNNRPVDPEAYFFPATHASLLIAQTGTNQ